MNSRKTMKLPIRVLSRLLFAITAFALSNSVQAQTSPRTASPLAAKEGTPIVTADSGTTSHALTAADLEAFLDGLMPAQLERENIAGAVIAVVKDGQVLLAKGYGYSDMAKGTPVTPDATLFRPVFWARFPSV